MAALNTPVFNFTFDRSAAPFTVTPRAYMDTHQDPRFKYLATGAFVFDTRDLATPPRILLLQRAASDSMPNRWEVPGGACDNDDESVLYAVARELWEEAGLKARHISAPIGPPHIFWTRSGNRVAKFNFIVQVETGDESRYDVKLTPDEHQDYVWASEQEVMSKKARERNINLLFTTREQEEVILQAFELVKHT